MEVIGWTVGIILLLAPIVIPAIRFIGGLVGDGVGLVGDVAEGRGELRAAKDVRNPTTTVARLTQIANEEARTDSELLAQILQHPNVTPELAQWAAGYADVATSRDPRVWLDYPPPPGSVERS
jgi:hypothetical protein